MMNGDRGDYNQRQVVGVNASGEFPGLTHFRNKPEEGYLNLQESKDIYAWMTQTLLWMSS